MAANPTMVLDPELWAKIAKEAIRRRKKPQNFGQEVMREYLEREADFAWWRSIRREYRGRGMTEQESVEFVRKVRRERKQSQNSSVAPRARNSKIATAK